VHTILHKALSDAVRWSFVARNVAAAANPPSTSSSGRVMKTWSVEELRTFLVHVHEDRLYAAWLLASATGMRRGEVLGLRWEDLDLDASRLAVRQTLVSIAYELHFSTPKTGRSRRSVALDVATVAALRSHRARQAEERLAWGEGYQDGALVFAQENGEPIHPERLTQLFDKHVRYSRVPRIRFHDLRHTHATLSLQAGIHPKVVSERLGHTTVAFTLDVYSHAIPAMHAEAAQRVADLVFGPPKRF
jgi:integrase